MNNISLLTNLPALPILAKSEGSFWLPPPDSQIAPIVDSLFYLILGISVFFFALITGLMVLFIVRYRERPGVGPQESSHHNTVLEITWTAIPVLIVLVIFVLGFSGYMEMRTPPANAYDVNVTAQKWSWSFEYPEHGFATNELHVPVNEPISLLMQSKDVIHSLFVPAFRVKMDVVPGRYTKAWFTATETGEYDLYCTEYCGTGHSDMVTRVVVHEPADFEVWLEEEANVVDRLGPVEGGRVLYTRNGCNQCHSIDGSASTGPTFKGIFGETHEFTNGSKRLVDENYIRESIIDPAGEVRKGFQNIMPTYKGRMKDTDIGAIIEFMKTLE